MNTATVGDPTQIDLDRDTTFPLFHIELKDVTVSEQTLDFTINLLACDVVDHTKEDNSDDNYQNKHIDYILNTQLNTMLEVTSDFMRGELRNLGFHTDDNFVCTPFEERFENILAGWETEIVIKTPNRYSICE